MKLAGVQHVSVNVHDIDEAGQFYIEVLGLEKLPRPDFGFPGMWLRVPDGREIHLMEMAEHARPAKMQHWAFEVTDIDEAREELLGRGIKVSETSGIPDRGRQCFFKDPSGNMIEFNEPVRSTL